MVTQNPGIRVPPPSSAHKDVRTAIQQIITRLRTNPSFHTLTLTGGWIVPPTRKTDTYTLTAADLEVFCNTDLRPWVAFLPTGIDGTHYRIVNTGSNDLTLRPKFPNKLFGDNSDFIISPGGDEVITFETIDGWW